MQILLKNPETLKLSVPHEIKTYVTNFLELNLVKSNYGTGNPTQQHYGYCSEIVTHGYFFGYPKELIGKFDDGIDFVYKGYNVDVKTASRKGYIKEGYETLFPLKQKSYRTDLVIFNNYNITEDVIEICGWIMKTDLFKYGKVINKGTILKRDDGTEFESKYDNIKIKYSDLNSIEILENL